ncbi:MAG: GvpL/GvpF family gas vesicle protein [Gaiellaceae bacterium]
MIRVYAFALRLDRLPDVSGVGGARLAAHRLGDLSAVVSVESAAPAGDPRQDAVLHGLVVEALMECASAVLPVRFGETFADDVSLDGAIAERIEELRLALERVRDCVEVGVRLAVPEALAPVAPAANGTGYMRGRLESLAGPAQLHEDLEALTRASVGSAGGERCYLVERSQVGAVEACVRRFAASHPEASVVCTGPWAPYSFGGGW